MMAHRSVFVCLVAEMLCIAGNGTQSPNIHMKIFALDDKRSVWLSSNLTLYSNAVRPRPLCSWVDAAASHHEHFAGGTLLACAPQ